MNIIWISPIKYNDNKKLHDILNDIKYELIY